MSDSSLFGIQRWNRELPREKKSVFRPKNSHKNRQISTLPISVSLFFSTLLWGVKLAGHRCKKKLRFEYPYESGITNVLFFRKITFFCEKLRRLSFNWCFSNWLGKGYINNNILVWDNHWKNNIDFLFISMLQIFYSLLFSQRRTLTQKVLLISQCPFKHIQPFGPQAAFYV